ncbi:MAG: MFS transporter [Actinomycetota bacterium]|nr:MFS transporter [Actinomycetota bacterium]
MNSRSKTRFTPAVTAIIIFGIISMLGDMVYESARSANSQYFNLLGISAATVGLVFGIGEFLGYFLRLIAGILSDKSGKYWLFIFLGYGMLLAVPLIGFTRNWNIIVVLILIERIGKSLRNPARDTVLSGVAENQVGVGFAFGIQEALDQVGAFVGPLIFTLVFYLAEKNGVAQYQTGYKILFIPFVLLIFFLFYAWRRIERDKLIPDSTKREFHSEHLKPVFWIYTAFTFFCTLGFVNFSLIGYHLKDNNLMSDGNITLLYSVAMFVDAIAALIIGKAYDHIKKRTGMEKGGLLVLVIIPILSLLLPFLTLRNTVMPIIIGMVIFGIVIGTHETIMRSAIADIAPFSKRGTGYGIFNTSYGLALLGGAALMGWLYDLNRIGIIIVFTCATQVIALLLYLKMNRMVRVSNQ